MKILKVITQNAISVLLISVCISFSNCDKEPVRESKPIPDALEQNKRLGSGGNLGNILYRFETWDK